MLAVSTRTPAQKRSSARRRGPPGLSRRVPRHSRPEPPPTGRHAALLVLVFGLCACSSQTTPFELQPLATVTFDVYRVGTGTTYRADSPGRSYSGTLKTVVESASAYATAGGGGTLNFRAGDFDLGSTNFEFYDVAGVTFAGAGVDATVLRNSSSAATDTEPFDCTRCDRLTVRDLTVSAGGAVRTTSDALDFDGGDDIVIERVKVTKSRGRGIVFDGKGSPAEGLGTADRNVVRDCVVTGVPFHGIELLASSQNRIENCEITDVGGAGITANKASGSARQPNKKSSDNVIRGNRVINAGQDGIRVNSSDRNLVANNTVRNSSDDTASRDGIRVMSADGVGCDDNTVEGNTATDDQTPKTQKYGLKIMSPNCRRTVVRGNTLTGNLTGEISDLGTGTIYGGSSDTVPPTPPTNLAAAATSSVQVSLSWTAATDNVGVTGYDVLRDGALLASQGGATTFSDTAARPGTLYSYQVRAKDAAGNVSPPSSPATVTTPTGASSTFTAVADSYLRSDLPGGNYGGSSSLRADGSPAEHTLLKFSVSGVGTGRVARAVLRLHNTNSSMRGGDVYGVGDTTWAENSVTWANAPAASTGLLASFGQVVPGTWYDVPVTAAVTGDGWVAFKLTSPSTDGAWYASKEGAAGLAPQLIVTVTP